MQVGAADPARHHLHSDFTGCWPRIGSLNQSERFAGPLQHHRLHADESSAQAPRRKAVERGA